MGSRCIGLLALLLGAAPLACARGESAEDRQLAQLREEITRVQADRDRFEQRVNALELQAADAQKGGTPANAAAAAPRDETPTPKLRVVKLGPDGAEEAHAAAETAADASAPPASDDPQDDGPRPTLKMVGTPQMRGQGAVIEQSIPDDDDGSRPSALRPDARRAYDSALALVNGRQYARALDAFAAFLVKYPDHPNADNAIYWRGECYFAMGDFAKAAEQFEGVLARFPGGNKAPDALLKLGITEQRLGDAQKARAAFDRLRRDWPRSEAARRIPSEAP